MSGRGDPGVPLGGTSPDATGGALRGGSAPPPQETEKPDDRERAAGVEARVERVAGAVLFALLSWHGVEKVQTGLLPEMAWTCHLATAIAALGLLAGRPALAVFGGMFHLVCGLPGWLLEVALHGTTPSSVALHVVTPAIGAWAARRHGVPAWIAAAGIALWLSGQGIGRLLDPALNVNLAWRPFDVWPEGTPAWVSHLANALAVGGSLLAASRVAAKLEVVVDEVDGDGGRGEGHVG